MWTLLQDIEKVWSLADVFSDRRVGPLKLSTTICWRDNIAQCLQSMQSSATSGRSELLQLVHLHSVTHHCKSGHVVDMCTSLCCTFSCNYNIWCLAVLPVPQACQSVLVDIFHLQCATPHSSGFILSHFPFPVHYMIVFLTRFNKIDILGTPRMAVD